VVVSTCDRPQILLCCGEVPIHGIPTFVGRSYRAGEYPERTRAGNATEAPVPSTEVAYSVGARAC
jgi:hypothetical protein